MFEARNEISLQPSLFRAEQAKLLQPVFMGEMLQPLDSYSWPSFGTSPKAPHLFCRPQTGM